MNAKNEKKKEEQQNEKEEQQQQTTKQVKNSSTMKEYSLTQSEKPLPFTLLTDEKQKIFAGRKRRLEQH